MTELLDAFKEWIVSSVGSWGYIGIFVFMALESACITNPRAVAMPVGGLLAAEGRLSFFWVGMIGAVANLVGGFKDEQPVADTPMADFELPQCRKCGEGKLVPLSDYGRDGAPITYKAWVCTSPDCGFNIRIDNGEISFGRLITQSYK
jgi:hypothetical protein